MQKNNGINNHPIGVFDSGLGGLTVVKEFIRQLPHEEVVYFGDTARVPYGTKSREAVVRFSIENVAALLRHRVKAVVVACNTSSSWALEAIKERYDLPIVGVIEPGARKAAEVTRNKRVGVIATTSTIKSGQYTAYIKAHDSAIQVYSQACPLFVPLVEEGWLDHAVTYKVAEEYLSEMKKKDVDTIVLGCTHYPLLTKVIQDVMGDKVMLVNSASEVAKEVKILLEANNLLHRTEHKRSNTFLVSDEPEHFQRQAGRFLGDEVQNVQRV